jgi:hypothetical protein
MMITQMSTDVSFATHVVQILSCMHAWRKNLDVDDKTNVCCTHDIVIKKNTLSEKDGRHACCAQ